MTSKTTVKSVTSSKKNPYGVVRAILRDKDGTIVQETSQNIDSFLYSHSKLLYNQYKTGSVIAPDSVGVVSLTNVARQYAYTGIISDSTLSSTGYVGIIVGTGDTAVSYGDTNLDGLIDHGTSAGNLFFRKNSIINYETQNKQYLQRSFENQSGSAITVKECGIAVSQQPSVSEKGFSVLVVRDVLETPITVDNGQTLSVVYEFKVNAANINWFIDNVQGLIGGSPTQPNSGTRALYTNTGSRVSGTFGSGGAFVQLSTIADQGIVVSTNSSGNATYSTYEIPNRISHGLNTGELLYFDCTVKSESYDNTNGIGILELQREFLNHSNGNVTISSVGLRGSRAVQFQTYAYILDWQQLPVPITLTNGQGETFVWRFEYEL
jgi:hypothetical protein